jgi:hypothetical protein
MEFLFCDFRIFECKLTMEILPNKRRSIINEDEIFVKP